jgi:hypothetical protein
MIKSSLTLLVTLTCTLGAGCSGLDTSAPVVRVPEARVPVLTRLEITPANLVLSPATTGKLSIKASDQSGLPMVEPVDKNGVGEWAKMISYASSNPQIARVTTSGVVTGVSDGNVEITASLKLDGVTRTASARTIVSTLAGFPSGIYDLTATVTNFDAAWGDLTGYRYTAVLTFPGSAAGATWDNYRLIDAAGVTSDWARNGTIDNYNDFAGRLVSELVSPNLHVVLVEPVRNSIDSRLVTGHWGCCGHIAGSFTATRRE